METLLILNSLALQWQMKQQPYLSHDYFLEALCALIQGQNLYALWCFFFSLIDTILSVFWYLLHKSCVKRTGGAGELFYRSVFARTFAIQTNPIGYNYTCIFKRNWNCELIQLPQSRCCCCLKGIHSACTVSCSSVRTIFQLFSNYNPNVIFFFFSVDWEFYFWLYDQCCSVWRWTLATVSSCLFTNVL